MILAVASIALWLAIALSPLGTYWERAMVTHVLVEFPLLVAMGFVWGRAIAARVRQPLEKIDPFGIAGVSVAAFTLAFWMIPRWLDASLTLEWIRLAKLVTLPTMVGLPFALGWHNLPTLGRAVLKIEFVTMLLRLGWIYIVAPDRLCNNYLLGEQIVVGYGLMFIALASSLCWIYRVFTAPSPYTANRIG